MIWRRLPVRIHIWGGLGSQLYGWALAIILQHSLGRKITFIFHSSGVTQREPELLFLSNEFKVKIIKDFVPNKVSGIVTSDKGHSLRNKTRKCVGRLLSQGKVSLSELSANPAISIRPWTLSLRGHYSNIEIPDWVHREMIRQASKYSLLQIRNDLLDTTLIHYRLGDLLELEGKPPLDPSRFSKIPFSQSPIAVISDSPEMAKEILQSSLGREINIVTTLNGWDAISSIISSRTFIGTPSKISFWAIAWRIEIKPLGVSMMPSEYVGHLYSLIRADDFRNVVTF